MPEFPKRSQIDLALDSNCLRNAAPLREVSGIIHRGFRPEPRKAISVGYRANRGHPTRSTGSALRNIR